MKNWKRLNRDEDLIHLLKQSKGSFRFDHQGIKYRLLSSINHADQKAIHGFQMTRVIRYSVGFAGFVVILSATFAFASSSKPGDKLFALNKAGEHVVLSLPMPVQQKAQMEVYIVNQRFEALDNIETKTVDMNIVGPLEPKKLQTVKESDESLNSAIEHVTLNKKQLESKGNVKAAAKLEAVLDQLQSIAEKRETKLRELKEKTSDEHQKIEIEAHLKQIQTSRKKAQSEIKRFQIDPKPDSIKH